MKKPPPKEPAKPKPTPPPPKPAADPPKPKPKPQKKADPYYEKEIENIPVSLGGSFIYSAKKESVHSSLVLPYSRCIEATFFKFCTDIPCSMDKTIINFVLNGHFILKNKFHLFVTHH